MDKARETRQSERKQAVNQCESIANKLDKEYEAERDREARVPAVWEDEEETSFTPPLQPLSGGRKTAEATPYRPPAGGGLDLILSPSGCNSDLRC